MKSSTKIILAIAGIVLGLFLYRLTYYIYMFQTGRLKPPAHFTAVKLSTKKNEAPAKTEEIINAAAPFYGATSPELTIVEFGNFMCPYSREVAGPAREAMLKYKNKIKFIYRDFPLDDIYPNSTLYSLSGRCAAEQGNFWAIFDRFYAAPDADIALAVAQSGLNKQKFADCFGGQKYIKNLQDDLVQGYKNGVRGTPTFFFIKKGAESEPVKIEGAMPKEYFQQIVDNLLKN